MRLRFMLLLTGLLGAIPALAEEAEVAAPDGGVKTLSGMSVLGNSEAPKSLVIVPWKSSQIGDGIGIVDSLSNRPLPVDRDVFARELDYYGIRSSRPAEASDARLDVRVGTR